MSRAQKGKIVSIQTRQKMSKAHSGAKSHCYGKKWWNNGIEQKLLKNPPAEPGWRRGCLPLPESRKEQMRQLHLGKRWWTNGKEVKHCREAPGEGWYRKYQASHQN